MITAKEVREFQSTELSAKVLDQMDEIVADIKRAASNNESSVYLVGLDIYDDNYNELKAGGFEVTRSNGNLKVSW